MNILCSFLQPQFHKNWSVGRVVSVGWCHSAYFQIVYGSTNTNVSKPPNLYSHVSDILWPARSPSLTACDFFLLGYLKAKV